MHPLKLVAINGGKQYTLEKDLILIGRQEVCDIHIDHKSVSKQHAMLLVRDDKLWLRDLGSTNGCHVNGKRVRRSQVMAHDILGIAGFNFRVTSKDSVKKKEKLTAAGTAKLNHEELKRLEQGLNTAGGSGQGNAPVVRVNTLPDEYTPIADDEDA